MCTVEFFIPLYIVRRNNLYRGIILPNLHIVHWLNYGTSLVAIKSSQNSQRKKLYTTNLSIRDDKRLFKFVAEFCFRKRVFVGVSAFVEFAKKFRFIKLGVPLGRDV